ncbi:MAG: thioredoxin fold domain-containing protein [Verrucomicrobiaceae bacterium]|nr:thioredoxin fold domain-containing protein [Verrucomicrobiaceae bacterium]
MKSLITLLIGTQLLIAQSDLVLTGADGHDHKPFASGGKKATVYFFVSPYCSTSGTFMKEMNAITADYAERATVYFVHSDADQKLTDILQHAEMNEIKATVLMDHEQKLAQHFSAKVTPEAVLTTPDGKVAYQGRINDLYLGPTKRQRQATTKDLRDALEALLSGKPIPIPRTEAMGCKISGLKR